MLTGCDDLFSPAIENFQGVENMYNDAEYARGILHNVYSLIPGYYDNSEYGTDDAVTNQPSNLYLQIPPIRSLHGFQKSHSWYPQGFLYCQKHYM